MPIARRGADAPKTAKDSHVSATAAKRDFGRMLERAMQGHQVIITKHDTPKAVLLSIDDFTALSQASRRQLEDLTAEFDEQLARMQAPGTRAKMRRAFKAPPAALGAAAVKIARKRG